MIFNKKSLVLIKTPKTGTESIKASLSYVANETHLNVLDVAYDNIFDQKQKRFDLSLNHINYDEKYLSHLRKIMNKELIFISSVRDPLSRAISHYNYSNPYRSLHNFNKFYKEVTLGNIPFKQYGTKGIDVLNNQMAHYMGYRNISEITEENIKNRFD